MRHEANDLDRAEDIYSRAIEADPKNTDILIGFAQFLNHDRKDTARADLFYKRGVEIEPENAFILGEYGRFLAVELGDAVAAEHYLKKSLALDPNDVSNSFNYGALLLSRGLTERGLNQIKLALAIKPDKSDDAFVLGAALHFFVHGPKDEQVKWLTELNRLVNNGIRADGWSFELTFNNPTFNHHPAKKWIRRLAEVITEKADSSTLKNWRAWKKTGSIANAVG